MVVIISFSCQSTKKLFDDPEYSFSKKERKTYGAIDEEKCHTRLAVLDSVKSEHELLMPANSLLFYHHLHGTETYTIDANSRKNPWRIAFEWEDKEQGKVKNVRLKDTH